MYDRRSYEALPKHGMREHRYTNEDINDSFVDPQEFARVSEVIEQLSELGFHGDSSIDLDRKRKSQLDYTNEATRRMIEEHIPTAEHWLSQIPTVMALESLYDPQALHYANGQQTSSEARAWLANCLDGIGIRSRGEVAQRIIVNEQPERIVSLGCGAGRSVLSSAQVLRDTTGRAPEAVMVDWDKRALALSQRNAEHLGVADTTQCRRKNILHPRGVAGNGLVERALYRRAQLAASSADIVDVVGVTEYLKPGDWSRGYVYNGVIEDKNGTGQGEGRQKTSAKPSFAGATTFLRNAYDLVKPGGLLMVGNMLDTHPQLGFTLNVIQWPHIQPRSISQMTEIFDKAELSMDREVHLPADGVYAIYAIRKPR